MLYLFLIIFVPTIIKCQIINRAPHFVPGSGDMARFSLSENTPVGSPVYQLKGKFLQLNSNWIQIFASLFVCVCGIANHCVKETITGD